MYGDDSRFRYEGEWNIFTGSEHDLPQVERPIMVVFKGLITPVLTKLILTIDNKYKYDIASVGAPNPGDCWQYIEIPKQLLANRIKYYETPYK